MQRLTGDQVRLDVAADAETLYALVSDVTRTPEWSPQVVACTWIPPATGPAAGARFRATNGVRRHTWSNVPVVETAQPGREFTFVRTARLGGTVRWRYRFEPNGNGTTVVESYEIVRPVPRVLHLLVRLSGVRDLEADLRANMQTSLRRLAGIAEAEVRQRSIPGEPVSHLSRVEPLDRGPERPPRPRSSSGTSGGTSSAGGSR